MDGITGKHFPSLSHVRKKTPGTISTTKKKPDLCSCQNIALRFNSTSSHQKLPVPQVFQLVVEPTHLEKNARQIGSFPQGIRVKITNN